MINIRGSFGDIVEPENELENDTTETQGNIASRGNQSIAVCQDYFEECCDVGKVLPTSDSLTKTTPRPVGSKKNKCGIRNVNGVSIRITGDVKGESQFGLYKNNYLISNSN